MHVNTTQIQECFAPSDKPYRAFGIKPARAGTFKQFDVHQVDLQNNCSTSTTELPASAPRRKKRTCSRQQRLAANNREKKRVKAMNKAFQELKNKVPGASGLWLSKINILKQATAYIEALDQQLRYIPDRSESIRQHSD